MVPWEDLKWNYEPHEIFEDDENIPLQFTGLLDKNGKEIYEGDIVDYCGTNETDRKYHFIDVVIMSDQGAWIARNQPVWNIGIYSNIEIIGNIHENPDLLSEIK